MREVLEALNALTAKGVLKNYAIGGAVGASFYVKAVQTEDVDAFVFLPESASRLISLEPVYEALRDEGGVVQGAYVRFKDWPLQILTDSNPLVAEAIDQALPVAFEGVPTQVFRAEHLVAIALQTARRKDFLRVALFLDENAVDRPRLLELITKYALEEQWKKANVEGSQHGQKS